MNINTKGRLGALVIAGSLAFGGLLVASPATATTAPPTPTVTVDCSAVTITTPAPGNALQAAGVVQVSGGTAESLNVTLDVQSGTNSYQKPLPLGDVTSNTPFDRERWYGFDDGLYTGVRLLEIVSRQPDANPVLKGLPDAISTPELNIKMNEGEPFALVDKLKAEASFEGAESMLTIDGVRVEYADGFGLARPSNTTPVVVLRFEADTQEAIERIQADFRHAIEGVWPGIQLPF